MRSYALIFAAVMLRILLPLLIIATEGDFDPAYRWVAWLCRVPNALWAEVVYPPVARLDRGAVIAGAGGTQTHFPDG